jgi:hypothetical protein
MTIEDVQREICKWKLTRERIVNLAIGLSSILIYEFIARPIYRPFIYGQDIYDFHIADTIGNTLGTIASVFIVIGLIGKGRAQHFFLMKTVIISVTLYEIVQPLMGKPIDPWDILATILTGGVCILMYKYIYVR